MPQPAPESDQKPLAGSCAHVWQDQKSQYLVAQVCTDCKLYRYKISVTADWEYRAPIPFGHIPVT
jgi:hypothetical protein